MLENLDTVTISPYMEMSRMKEFYNTAIESVSYGTADTDTAAQQMYKLYQRISGEDKKMKTRTYRNPVGVSKYTGLLLISPFIIGAAAVYSLSLSYARLLGYGL